MLNELAKKAHDAAVAKGFYDSARPLTELVMLVVTELAEVVEAERKGKIPGSINDALKGFADSRLWIRCRSGRVDEYEENIRGTIEEELADAFIRLLDICGYYNIDIDSAVKGKMLYNATRPRKHGKKY